MTLTACMRRHFKRQTVSHKHRAQRTALPSDRHEKHSNQRTNTSRRNAYIYEWDFWFWNHTLVARQALLWRFILRTKCVNGKSNKIILAFHQKMRGIKAKEKFQTQCHSPREYFNRPTLTHTYAITISMKFDGLHANPSIVPFFTK